MTRDEQAKAVLHNNDRGGYTVPTDNLYPYQWNWDSVFAALGFATFDLERAWLEIETLFQAQWPDGMLPHIVFRVDEPTYFPGPDVWQANHGPLPSSGISQPPVAATVIRMLAQSEPERARPYLGRLDAWHSWWHAARDPEKQGIIAITHPWESGRDNLPDWDLPGDAIDISGVGTYERRDTALVDMHMRPKKKDYDRYLALVAFGRERQWDAVRIAMESPFFVADVGITAILLRAERDLQALARRLGVPLKGIDERIDRLETGFERLWNPSANAYCSLDLRTGIHHDSANSATFLALYAGITPRMDALLCLLETFSRRVTYMVPSFDPASASFDHIRYWRGPVWPIMNFMIATGLNEVGETAWAERIRNDTRALMEQSGFAEYFSPVDGRGCGGGTFSWAAAIWLTWGLQHIAKTGGHDGGCQSHRCA